MSPHDLFYVALLLGAAYEYTLSRYGIPSDIDKNVISPWTIRMAVCTIVILFILRLALIHRAAIDVSTPAWLLHLPVIALYDAVSLRYTAYRQTIAFALACISIASAATLYLIHRSLENGRASRADWITIGAAHAALMISALLAPAMASTDAYYYAAYAQLGSGAYASHEVALPCPSAPPEPECMEPRVPTVYGPLYLAYTQILLRHVDSVAARIEILRITNALWFEAILLIFLLLGFEQRLIVLVALNPVIFAQYVCDAHNDIIPIAFILLGSACAARFPFAALALCAAASLIKLPFALLGLSAFLGLPARARLTWASTCLGSCVIVSWLWGGRPYLEALAYYGRFHHVTMSFAHWLAACVAIAVMGAAILRQRISFSGAFTLPALAGGSPFPWYALWALPYLQWDRTKLEVFLISLPATSFLMETPFQIPALWLAAIAAGTLMTLRPILAAHGSKTS